MRQPVFWLLAGPNGSGKSTFAESAIFENLAQTPEGEPLVRLNPDERARALRLRSPELSETELALRAAQESDDALDACLRAGRSVLVESVLSSEKFKSRVEAALAANMDFQLTFVVLRHPDLNVARVSQRVKLGGHGVEEGRIRARWLRSVENLPWFAARASALSVWDNTRAPNDRPPELVLAATRAEQYVNRAAALFVDLDADPALRRAIEAVIEAL